MMPVRPMLRMASQTRPPAIAGLALAAVLAGGCRRPAGASLTLAGSTSVQPFAEKWAEAFRETHPGVTLQVQGGGSTAGVQAAESGAAQLGMASRSLKRDEAAVLRGIVVARDGIAVVVHTSNAVSDLSLAQVRALYAGDAANWRDVGGADERVTAITREEGSGTRGAFEELVMGKRHIAASALVQDSTGAVRQMVSADPGATGYISLGLVDPTVKALRLGGVDATEQAIDEGGYPLVRPFLFVSKGEPSGAAKAFTDWVTGPEGHALTRREGLLPPKTER